VDGLQVKVASRFPNGFVSALFLVCGEASY